MEQLLDVDAYDKGPQEIYNFLSQHVNSLDSFDVNYLVMLMLNTDEGKNIIKSEVYKENNLIKSIIASKAKMISVGKIDLKTCKPCFGNKAMVRISNLQMLAIDKNFPELYQFLVTHYGVEHRPVYGYNLTFECTKKTTDKYEFIRIEKNINDVKSFKETNKEFLLNSKHHIQNFTNVEKETSRFNKWLALSIIFSWTLIVPIVGAIKMIALANKIYNYNQYQKDNKKQELREEAEDIEIGNAEKIIAEYNTYLRPGKGFTEKGNDALTLYKKHKEGFDCVVENGKQKRDKEVAGSSVIYRPVSSLG